MPKSVLRYIVIWKTCIGIYVAIHLGLYFSLLLSLVHDCGV